MVDSRRSLLSYDGLDASRTLAFYNDEAKEQDEESLFLWMRAHPFDDLVVLDVTASPSLAEQYLDFASYGFHVISANKLAGLQAAIITAKSAMRLRKLAATGCITPR